MTVEEWPSASTKVDCSPRTALRLQDRFARSTDTAGRLAFPRRRRPPLDLRQHRPAPERPPAQPARSTLLKQRRLRVVDAAGGQIRLDRLLGPVVPARRAASRPSRAAAASPPQFLSEVVLTPHPHGRAHPREAVHQHAQQRPVPQSDPRPRVGPVEERPRLGRRSAPASRPSSRHASDPAPPRPGQVHRRQSQSARIGTS